MQRPARHHAACLAGCVAALASAGVALTLVPAGDPVAGAKVFASSGCTACHTLAAAGSSAQAGPNLDGLQPTPERVQAQVTAGGPSMPPFRGTLTPLQISNVAEYVAQASRGWRPPAMPVEPTPTSPASPGTTPTAGGASTLTLRLSEWRIAASARTLPAGPITFNVRNAGRRAHQLVILRTTRAARALPRRAGRVLEIGRVSGVVLSSGSSRRITARLSAGRYLLISNRPGDVGRGMALRLAVTAPTPTAAPPSPSPTPAAPAGLDGQALFRGTCGGCHTLAAAGTTGRQGPNLSGLSWSSAQVAGQIREGDPPDMPAFEGTLTPAQITAIADYVSSVGR